MPKAKTADIPLLKNEDVQELLAILSKHDMPSAQDLLAVVNQIDTMGKQLSVAVNELTAMRRELAEAQKQSHPVKDALKNAVKAMEKQVASLRERLAALKQNVVEGCKQAVAAFKEKGVAALDNTARFLHIRPGLEAMSRELDTAIREDDAAIAKIEAISTEYHNAGLHIKNMGRALLGKEVAQEAKAPGKLAALVSLPFRNERNAFAAMRKGAGNALSRLARLEQAAERSRPSINDTLNTLNAQIAQKEAQKAAPARSGQRDER